MKKSNALMLSYIIFLVLSILTQIIFDWEGLNIIAIAATIAGCFFAFSDLANWYVSYQFPLIEAMQKDYESLVNYHKTALDSISAQGKELDDTIALLTPYKDDFPNAAKFLELSKDIVEYNKERKSKVQNLSEGYGEIQAGLDKELGKLKAVKRIEIAFATIGFISFFALISFDYLLHVLEPFQSIATVLAFVIIMLNYYLRDVLEEKLKQEIDEIVSRAENEKEEIERMIEQATKTPLLDKVTELVDRIRKLNKLKEDAIDKTTENPE